MHDFTSWDLPGGQLDIGQSMMLVPPVMNATAAPGPSALPVSAAPHASIVPAQSPHLHPQPAMADLRAPPSELAPFPCPAARSPSLQDRDAHLDLSKLRAGYAGTSVLASASSNCNSLHGMQAPATAPSQQLVRDCCLAVKVCLQQSDGWPSLM